MALYWGFVSDDLGVSLFTLMMAIPIGTTMMNQPMEWGKMSRYKMM